MPRRRGRLRRRARRLRRAGPRALRRLPGRQPRPRRARRARHRLLLGGGGGRGRVDPRATSPSRRWSSCASSSRPGEREGIGLFHASPRDPVWEYVLSIEQADACMDAQPERIALDRPLPRLPLLHPARGRRHGETRGAQAERRRAARPRPRAAGWSTPAASASRATATRAPPGWSSTPRRRRPASTASTTTSTAPPRRSSTAGLPKRLADRLYIGQ